MGRALTSRDLKSDGKVYMARRRFALKIAGGDHLKADKLLREHGYDSHGRLAKGASDHA